MIQLSLKIAKGKQQFFCKYVKHLLQQLNAICDLV